MNRNYSYYNGEASFPQKGSFHACFQKRLNLMHVFKTIWYQFTSK